MVAAFRYQYKCSITKAIVTYDANGDPIATTESIDFYADYQPNQKDVFVNQNGDKIPITFKLFVSPKNKDSVFDFTFDKTFGYTTQVGDTMSADGVAGTIVRVFRTRLNTEIWVK
jgi:hypothetical protein